MHTHAHAHAQCAAGKYQPAAQQTSCIVCQEGKKGPAAGVNAGDEATSCSGCEVGTYQDTAASTSCKEVICLLACLATMKMVIH